ncbi:hypothetical protein [Pseudonocardia xishanensis]|uniref:Uncharacterized protein n=1 Tax=Pseudonocardia xishanensis TaxID=630995 RepID=A0ABP8RUX5_9PSEU
MTDLGDPDSSSGSESEQLDGPLDQVPQQAAIDAVRAALRPAESPEQIAEVA